MRRLMPIAAMTGLFFVGCEGMSVLLETEVRDAMAPAPDQQLPAEDTASSTDAPVDSGSPALPDQGDAGSHDDQRIDNDQLVDGGEPAPDLDLPSHSELAYKSDFETGAIQSKSSNPDGWLRQTMDAAYPGGTYAYSDQVITSDGSVAPRAGKYFVRFEVRAADNPLANDFNPRAQLRLSPAAYEIDYGVTHWIGWSTYLPSRQFRPTNNTFLAQIFINGVNDGGPMWMLKYNGANDSFQTTAWYYEAGVRTQHDSSAGGLGWRNPISAHKDEWIDWRLEVRASNDSKGKIILWQRRPRVSASFTKVAEHSGPVGRQPGDGHSFILDVYGGNNWPLVAYHDEVRITNARIGSAEAVDIP